MNRKGKEAKPESISTVPAVYQASKILICLAQNSSSKMNLTEICKNVGIHKSKGHSILKTFQKFGFVQKDPVGKRYSLGLGLISLARRVLDNLNYNEIAHTFLQTLVKKTHSTAFFGIINEGNFFVVAKKETDMRIGVTTRLGHRFNITHGAHGKAILAFSPLEEREKILKQKKLYFHGNASKFDPKRLESEITECKKLGYAFDMGELNAGINVIASAVFNSLGKLIGSIFIMGTFEESSIQEYGHIVAETAKQFSYRLGADIDKAYYNSI